MVQGIMPAQYTNPLLEGRLEDSLPEPLFLHPSKREARYEKQQCIDEGLDISPLEDEFDTLLQKSDITSDELNALFDATRDLPQRTEYPYYEPSSLDEIRSVRPSGPRQLDRTLDDLRDPYDTIHGGWTGAIAGCLLGNPVQGWSRERILGYLRATNQYPLHGYIRSDVSENTIREYDIYHNIEATSKTESTFINDVSQMPIDDDIDYILVGLKVASEHGPSFDPTDVANSWLENIPAFRTYTAERIAYRNFMNQIMPPESGSYRNPYREHVGALIRSDMWGYLSLGDPEQAAELAWRDATISHTKNGIYGAMWAAAMIAAAPFESDPKELLKLGLTEIPAESRLTEAVSDVIDWYDAGINYESAVVNVHEQWSEDDQFDWVHTISNAQVLSTGLLWGQGDFGTSLCLAVQAGFDTDSHGATLGSIVGLMTGADNISPKWTEPLNDRLDSSLVAYQRQRISRLVEQTLDVARRFE